MVLKILKSENFNKYVYTVILCLNHIAFGICMTAMSPIMVEMKDILNISMSSISLYSTFLSIGFQLGALSAFSFKYVNRQLALTASTTLISLSISMFPYSPNLSVLFGLTMIMGMGSGVVNTVINIWLAQLWQHNCGPILQIPGFTFGIGTILSPLILKPYLRNSNQTHVNSTQITTTTEPDKEVYFEWERRQLLKTPFLIIGYIQILFPLLLGIMYLVKRYRPPAQESPSIKKDMNENIAQNKCKTSSKLFDKQSKQVKILAILVFVGMASSYSVCESAFLVYFDTYYQYSPLRLSTTKAAEVILGFTTSYTAYRFVSILVALKLSPKQMLSIHYIILIFGVVCLVFARHSHSMVWVANIVIGIGCSAIFPAIYTLMSQYIELTDGLGAIMMFSGSALNMLFPYILGLFIEQYSYVYIVYVSVTLGITLIMFIVILYLIIKYSLIEKLTKSTQNY